MLAALFSTAQAQVVINEFCSKTSEQILHYATDGTPLVGYLPKWNSSSFSDTPWTSGLLPAGYGSTVNTNLQSAMQNKTPSLYLRKSFTVTAAQATSTQPLTLQVDYDDGFVAYLNGVEVARYNCGAAKNFLYASQPAYNVTTASGLTEITLGAANTVLLTGTNILSIEARNFDFGSNFRVNAGLKLITSTTPISVVKALYNNDAATGASRTHTNTNGSITNTASGTPISGGWLANATDPASDNLWTSLQIVTAELAGAGVGGSGGLRYTITQTGANHVVTMTAPSVSMANAWSPGGLSVSSLSSTTIKGRYRTTGDLQFAFRCDPGVGQGANSLDGFPIFGLPIGGTPDFDWATASGGTLTAVIDAAGGKTTNSGGSINTSNYEHNVGAGVRSGTVTIKEDSTAGAGPGGTTGIFSYIWTAVPTTIDSLGFGIKNLQVLQWSGGNISAVDFQRTRLSFRWKLPVGRSETFNLEWVNGSLASDAANIGILTGTGNWETYTASLSNIPNSAALRTKLNANFSGVTKLTGYYAGVPFANGEAVQIDNLNIYYETVGAQVEENPANTFSFASGAIRTRTINAAGTVSDTTTGTPVNTVTLNSDPAITGLTFQVIEDNTAAAGNGGTAGFLRCNVTQPPTTGGPWGFSLPGTTVRNWTAGAITTSNLADVALQMAVKIPAGVTMNLYVEPVGGSTANRASMGTLTGNGTWQTVSREFASATNVDNFRTALNTANTTTFQITFVGPSVPTAGDQISVDDIQISLWRAYQVLMNQGTSTNQQRFLDTLNGTSSVTFIPTFVKSLTAPNTGGTLTIDNFEVDYNGQDPNAFQVLISPGAAGGNWKYFVGLAEPSGGLYDPALLTGFVQPPAGEEQDYSNPQSFRDWLELKNTGGSAVSLTNWTMTDDTKYPAKWTFPSGTQIPAGGYLIVMCDNRNEANGTATYIHSSFSLDGGTPKIYLYNGSGTLQDQVDGGPGQDAFHTYARFPDGTGPFAFTDSGTPGAANAGITSSARVKQPDFFKSDGVTALPGGFYATAQTLVISTVTTGTQIRYTTDGTDPTETTGTVYSAPISLTTPGDGKSATTVIARAFRSGMLASDPRIKSYLINVNTALKSLPTLLYSADGGRNLYLPNGIMAILGGTYPGGLWAANGPQSYNIPQGHGDPYERGISAEYYYPSGIDGWREDVGIRISSSPYSRPRLILNSTSNSPWTADPTQKPSFDVYWRSDYGNSTVSDENLIPGNDVSDYSRLRIRAGKNDISNPFIIDEVGRRLYHDMGWVQPIGSFNTMYANGSLKGLYNLTERLRSQTFQIHYRTTNDFDVDYIDTFVDGDAVFWNQMQTALNNLYNTPATSTAQLLTNYQTAQQYIDTTNVADAFLFWIYVNMDDWPTNNWAAQRERSATGVFRMATWDMEAAFGRFGKAVTFDTINSNLLNSSSTCGDIFKHLYKSPDFRQLVADRIQKHFFNGGTLDDRVSGGHIGALVNAYAAQVQPMLTYLGYGTVDLSWYNNHVAGRRNFLFAGANATGSFQQTSLWPATLPPTFSKQGGAVAAGYQLTITTTAPAGSVIYYTLDGSDPRLPGGGVAPGALIYTGPVTLNFLTTVNSRILNKRTISNISTGASPVVTTTTAHGFTNGDTVTITGSNSTPNFDGVKIISSVSSNSFTVSGGGITVTSAGTQGNAFEWSGLNSAYFEPAAAQPTAGTLAITELMYHPADPTYTERVSGYTSSDDFEFVRLTNIGAAPVDLHNLRFSQGITYDFTNTAVGAINPGASVLVVHNKDGFQFRYGLSYNSTIAGEYAGTFSNSGETVTLSIVNGANTTTLETFVYSDSAPWPISADGHGPSLILINSAVPNNGASWVASAQPNGMPGGVVRPLTYSGWKQFVFNETDTGNGAVSGPLVDSEGDGMNNFLEYTLGGVPSLPDRKQHEPVVTIENVGGQNYVTLTYALNGGASDATVVPEVSGNLSTWSSGAGNVVTVSGPTNNLDGSVSWKVRDATPITSANQRYIHLKATGP